MEKELKSFIESVWFELSDESRFRYYKLLEEENNEPKFEIVGRYYGTS